MKLTGISGPFRRMRVGVEIGRSSDARFAVRLIALSGKTTLWRHATAVPNVDCLAAALTSALRELPPRWRFSPRVTIALGPSLTQVKRLNGLPPISNPVELEAMLRANAARFFLKNGVPIVTSSVRIDAPGQAWGAAAEQPIVSAGEIACRSTGLRLRGVVPTVAILGTAHRSPAPASASDPGTETRICADGGRRFGLTYAGPLLIDVHRIDGRAESSSDDDVASSRSDLGQDDWTGAYHAAVAADPLPLSWPIDRRDTRPLSRTRQIGASVALVVAITLACLAPTVSAARVARHASRYLRGTASQQRAGIATGDSLSRVTSALTDARAFVVARRSATFGLADLTDALPDSAAITAYHADTAGGVIILLAPHASDLVSQLERDPRIMGIQIVGSVTQEPPSSTPGSVRTLERATVRFRWKDVQ